MPSQDSFTSAYDPLPVCITLSQAQALIALFRDMPKDSFSYRAVKKFVHDHRAAVTTPESRRKAPKGRGSTKNKNKAYIYKDKLLEAMQKVYNTPPSRVDASIWIPFDAFAVIYHLRFPTRSQKPKALRAWLDKYKVRKLYSCRQVRHYKTQFISCEDARKRGFDISCHNDGYAIFAI